MAILLHKKSFLTNLASGDVLGVIVSTYIIRPTLLKTLQYIYLTFKFKSVNSYLYLHRQQSKMPPPKQVNL